ncbi:transcription factor Pcc1-domain-containing protein [Stachybotrys elegans]|uniref:Transcription factor Pcc1-domain-containing protein n=1 Tax=Stachybotrys elegans TaxID=80388 RepID=A0A8K0WYM2_9HYPO|nr:transcription factor Pcc1-domain-containing protein [Stachybotrys elegans]
MSDPSRHPLAMDRPSQDDFPCSLTIDVPFPTSRLAETALKSIQVDPELSPLVWRGFTVVDAPDASDPDASSILRVAYMAATNRMLRVAVNSFMDSLKLVLEVMQELDVDVLEKQDNPSNS